MFKQQQQLVNILPDIKNLYQKYQLDTQPLTKMENNTLNFKVRIPLIGAFSAGKSSLINALLERNLLAVEIDPASNLATEISYSEHEQILGFNHNQLVREFTAAQVKAQDFQELAPDGHIEITINNPFFKSIRHLCLADLPGLDSKSEAHSQAIQHYLGRSLAYCILVSAEEGTLKGTIKLFLTELALHHYPILVIISKCDKRSCSDIEAIKKQVKQQVQDILPPDNYLNIIAASREELHEVIDALHRLEQMSEQRFQETLGQQSLQFIQTLYHHIEILNNQENLDIVELKLKQEKIEQDMQDFQQKLQNENQAIHHRFDDVFKQISQHIRNRLISEMDSFTERLLKQQDMQQNFTYIVRTAMTEGITRYFKPLIEKYITRIDAELPQYLQINQDFNTSFNTQKTAKDNDFNSILWDKVTLLLPVVLKIFPYAAILLPIIGVISSLFSSKNNAGQQHAEQYQQARNYIENRIIPQIMQQVESHLRTILTTQLEEVEKNVQQHIQDKYQQEQATLNQLAQQLQQGESAIAQQRIMYQHDQRILSDYQNCLISQSTGY